jgi:alpha-N-arabinofuranosidase
MVEHRQRDVRPLADGHHAAEPLHHQAQPVREGNAAGGSDDHHRGCGRHAGGNGNYRISSLLDRQSRRGVRRSGRLELRDAEGVGALLRLPGLAEHLYPRGNAAFDVDKQDFVVVEEPLAWSARRLPNRVKTAVEAWQEYQRRFPQLDMKSIKIALDEYAPGRPGIRTPLFSTLSTAEALHELFRNSKWFVMAEFTHLTGLVRIDPVRANIQPVGEMFKLYRHHFGSIPVAVSGNAPQPDVKGLVALDKPMVPSGSDTYPLDVAAALSADRKVLTVAVVNPSETEQTIAVKFAGVALRPQGTLYRMEAPGAAVAPQGARIGESALARVPATLVLPAQSISLYELPVR